jgi:hypothetical protein
MTAVTFGTLKFVKKLEAAGLPTPQAEAIADAFREATSEPPGKQVVTRDYSQARSMADWILVAAAQIPPCGAPLPRGVAYPQAPSSNHDPCPPTPARTTTTATRACSRTASWCATARHWTA